MRISLRKASVLAKEASMTASKITLTTIGSLNAYSTNADTNYKTLLKEFSDNYQKILALLECVRQIREAIGKKNNNQIDALLTEMNFIDSFQKIVAPQIDQLKQGKRGILRLYDEQSINVAHDATTVRIAMENAKNSKNNNGDIPIIQFPALPHEDIEKLEKKNNARKRRRRDIMDDLTRLNLSETITLSDNIVFVLREHGILE